MNVPSSARILAVILAAITGIIHLVLFVSDLGIPYEQSVGNPAFILSGIIYLLGSVLILWKPSNKLYSLGIIFAMLNIIIYFLSRLGLYAPSSSDEYSYYYLPPLEIIGVSDKLIEIILIINLFFLSKMKKSS